MTPLNVGKTRAAVGVAAGAGANTGFNLAVEEGRIEPQAVLVEKTSTESTTDSAGITYTGQFPTAAGCKVSLTFAYDGDNPPSSSPPAFVKGALVSNFRVYMSTRLVAGVKTSQPSVDPNYYFPRMYVESPGVTLRIKDKVMMTVTLVSDDVWYEPGTAGSSA